MLEKYPTFTQTHSCCVLQHNKTKICLCYKTTKTPPPKNKTNEEKWMVDLLLPQIPLSLSNPTVDVNKRVRN